MAVKKDVPARGADDEQSGSGATVRRRWHKYAGIKPERGRSRLKSIAEEVASLSNLEAEAMDILWDMGRPASLKAYLVAYGISFPFTHNLEKLIEICEQHNA